MRRYFVLLAGFAVVQSSIACCHVAGKCDCQPNISSCCKYGLYQNDAPAVVNVEAPKSESLPPAAPPAAMPPKAPTGGSGM